MSWFKHPHWPQRKEKRMAQFKISFLSSQGTMATKTIEADDYETDDNGYIQFTDEEDNVIATLNLGDNCMVEKVIKD